VTWGRIKTFGFTDSLCCLEKCYLNRSGAQSHRVVLLHYRGNMATVSPNGTGLNDHVALANNHPLGDINPLGYYIHWVNHTHWGNDS
jgi:hypothetical protein